MSYNYTSDHPTFLLQYYRLSYIYEKSNTEVYASMYKRFGFRTWIDGDTHDWRSTNWPYGILYLAGKRDQDGKVL